MDFKIPGAAEDLEKAPEGDSSFIYVTNVHDLATEDAQLIAEETIERLDRSDDPTEPIFDQEVFDKIYSLCRGMAHLPSALRLGIVECLARSLRSLNERIFDQLDEMPNVEMTVERETSLKSSRNALKAYTYFLFLALTEASHASPMAAQAGPRKGKKRPAPKGKSKTDGDEDEGEDEEGGRKAPAGPPFDATLAREKALEALAVTYQLDLVQVFRPEHVDDVMVGTTLKVAYDCLADRELVRQEKNLNMLAVLLGNPALVYNQHETVASVLFDMINRYEHVPAALATLCQKIEGMIEVTVKAKLTLQLVFEVAHVDPASYAEQQRQDSQGLKNVALFISQLAARTPRSLLGNLAMLEPHLGGDAFTLRMEIVTAIGLLLVHLSTQGALDGAADAQQALARMKTKGRLVETLMQRVFDSSVYVRNRALQSIEALVHANAVDMGKIVLVTELAVGRLEDKGALVRKAALRLLQKLLTSSPFIKGGKLQAARFEASLADVEARIRELMPREDPREAQMAADPFAAPAAEAPAEAPEAEEDATDMIQLEKGRGLAASLKSAVDFVKVLSGALPLVTQLLASTNDSDVEESVHMLVEAVTHDLDGARPAARKMLPLIFAKEASVRACVLEAVHKLYLDPQSPLAEGLRMSAEQRVAVNLIELAKGSTLGELSALEEILHLLVAPEEGAMDGKLDASVIEALFAECERATAAAAGGARGATEVARTSMHLLSMVAGTRPDVVVSNFDQVTKGALAANDGLLRRYAAVCLQRLQPIVRDRFRLERGLPAITAQEAATRAALAQAGKAAGRGAKAGARPAPRSPQSDAIERLTVEMMEDAFCSLTATVLCPAGTVSNDAWFSACEASITALYLLHPSPDLVLQGVLVELHARVAGVERVATDALSRLLFVLGHTALQQLLHVETVAKQVRLLRLDRDRAAGEANAEAALKAQAAAKENEGGAEGEGAAPPRRKKGVKKGDKDAEKEKEDIAAQLGVGSSVTEDAELDQLAEQIQRSLLSSTTLVGKFGPLVQALCRDHPAMAADPTLRSSALLALTKLMAVDDAFCEENLPHMFTWLENRGRVEPEVRSNLVVGLGDLVVRHPNTLEPWTENVYRTLGDPDAFVRRNAVMVVSHLILNDMMKARGNISHVAKCLVDADEGIQGLTKLFFQSLSEKKGAGGTNPIYNLLPDMLSSLSADPALPQEDFRRILAHLLGFISKDRHSEALVEKLVLRFEMTRELKQWRDIAYCLAQLTYNEKMIKKLADNLKKYKEPLYDEEVLEFFATIVTKSRRLAKEDLRKALDEFEEKLLAVAEARKDQRATEEGAQRAMEAAAKRGFKRTAAEAGLAEEQAGPREAAEPTPAKGRRGAVGKASKRGRKEAEEEEEEKPVAKKGKAVARKAPAAKKGGRKKRAASEEDEPSEEDPEEEENFE